jgi:2-polyprenyl-6-hydroxyphenyl methylase/3-demethylubiquinone-9 3-methyltransferase
MFSYLDSLGKCLRKGKGVYVYGRDSKKVITEIYPSEQSLTNAEKHVKDNNLKTNYERGTGENLPFQDNSFDVVFCCNVLEHVSDLPKVIAEISRVLKNGGIFFYDTFNRTILSKIGVIKILQEWKK